MIAKSALRLFGFALAPGARLAAAAAQRQSRDELLDGYRGERRAEFSHLSGPGEAETVHEHVRACVQARMAAAAPWLTKNVGPSQELLEWFEAAGLLAL